MFREWGFLLGEIWLLILLAALLGLLAGWLIWGGRKDTVTAGAAGDADLRNALNDCQRARAQDAQDMADLRAQLAKAEPAPVTAPPAAVAAAPVIETPAIETPEVEAPQDAAPVIEAARPAALDGPRDGQADDLKLIKGVGPQLEKLCNSLGFYHFDQIAAWTDAEIAWVDENLEGFKGRVTRDEWVAQARDLAAGKPPRPMAERP